VVGIAMGVVLLPDLSPPAEAQATTPAGATR
jgi:hypothetical protein